MLHGIAAPWWVARLEIGMGLGSHFARFLRKEQRMHAVWPPVASAVELGDYGAFDDGVFVRLGNIAEFGVQIMPQPTRAIATLRLASNGVTITRLQAGTKVPRITPVADVNAEVNVHFERAYSFLLYATGVEAVELKDVGATALQLATSGGWRRGFLGWKVVSKRYVASQVILLASREAQTDFSFHGEAKLLASYDGDAAIAAGVEHQANKAMALELRAGRGPIGVELFRVGFAGGAVPKGKEERTEPIKAEVIQEADWDAELPRDWS